MHLNRKHILLVICIASPWLAAAPSNATTYEWRPIPAWPTAAAVATETSCDDGSAGGTLVQRLDDWYGNRFVPACGGAQVQSLRFLHFGHGLPGPYALRVHFLDAQCAWIGSTPVLEVAGSPHEPGWAEIDLADRNWCVAGAFYLLVEPLTCADGLRGEDCFPALVVDASSDTDPGSHCAVVNSWQGEARGCGAARSADGRYFDFVLRPQLLCTAPGCQTAIESSSWSLLKRLYLDP